MDSLVASTPNESGTSAAPVTHDECALSVLQRLRINENDDLPQYAHAYIHQLEQRVSRLEAEQKLGRDAEAKKRVAAAAKEIPQIFEPEQVVWVFDAYVAILCFVYSIILKIEFKLLQDELSFSEDEKKIMAVPLAKICSKY